MLKTSAGAKLIQAILLAPRGKPRVTKTIENHSAYGRSHSERLTWRQREVVQLLAEGKTMKEAADVLNVSERTIAFHKYRVMHGLGFKTPADLIQFAMKRHIVVE